MSNKLLFKHQAARMLTDHNMKLVYHGNGSITAQYGIHCLTVPTIGVMVRKEDIQRIINELKEM